MILIVIGDKDMEKLSHLRNRLRAIKISNDLDKSLILDMVKKDPSKLKNLHEYQDDREVVMQAITINPSVFQYASERLRNDKEIALKVVAKNYEMLRFLGDELKENANVFLVAITNNYHSYRYLPESLKDNKEIMSVVISQIGEYLKDASPRLKDDEQLVLTAIKNSPSAFAYASSRLKNDLRFILKFFKIFPIRKENELRTFFASLPNEVVSLIIDNKIVMLELIKKIGTSAYLHVSDELKKDKEIVLETIKKSKTIPSRLPKELLDDKELMLQAVNISGYNLEFVSDRLKDDEDIVKTAIANAPKAIWKASRRLQMKYGTSY